LQIQNKIFKYYFIEEIFLFDFFYLEIEKNKLNRSF